MKTNDHEPDALRCPACGKPADAGGRYFPFCCERCKLVDLGRWFNEEYTIPAEEDADDSAEPPPPPGPE